MISKYWAEQVLAGALHNVAPTLPASGKLWMALTIKPVMEDDTGLTITEPAGGAYARVELDPGAGNYEIEQMAAWNKSGFIFPSPSGADWGYIVGWALLDGGPATGTSGNIYYAGETDPPFYVANGDPQPVFAKGTVQVDYKGRR